jgi:adiponectin receptor
MLSVNGFSKGTAAKGQRELTSSSNLTSYSSCVDITTYSTLKEEAPLIIQFHHITVGNMIQRRREAHGSLKPDHSGSVKSSKSTSPTKSASPSNSSHCPNIANSNAGVLLLTIDKIPSWYGDNPYIHNYYRPVFASVTPCFQSWLYLHNQSANIYTHLIPGILALFLNGGLFWLFREYYPDATFWDQAVFHVYLTACSLCFGTSAAYHTLLCHSHEFADLWVRLDYVSISVLILGSFVPGLYMGFYCEPLLLRGYLTMVRCES